MTVFVIIYEKDKVGLVELLCKENSKILSLPKYLMNYFVIARDEYIFNPNFSI